MNTAIFSAHAFERPNLVRAAEGKHELRFLDAPLSVETAILAKGCAAVALFVSDDASKPILQALAALDVKFIALRSAGFNSVDIAAAKELGIQVARVPAYDVTENAALAAEHGFTYCTLDDLCRSTDIISLHVPLNNQSRHLINAGRLAMMKETVMLINTSRGAIVNTGDMIDALKQSRVGYFGMDVYEEEEGLFSEDHSGDVLTGDHIARLMTFPNVLITSHQGFLTDTALQNIADTTVENLTCFERGTPSKNLVT